MAKEGRGLVEREIEMKGEKGGGERVAYSEGHEEGEGVVERGIKARGGNGMMEGRNG